MNDDMADGVLLDVREIDITDLLPEDMESALSRALDRLLRAGAESNYNSHNSSG